MNRVVVGAISLIAGAAVPAVGSTILIALFGRESRGRSLGELDARDAVRRAQSPI